MSGNIHDDLLRLEAELLRLVDRVQLLRTNLSPGVDAPSVRTLLAEPISSLGLRTRAHHCLGRQGVETIGDLVLKRGCELRRQPNFGKSSLDEVERALAARGLALRADWSPSAGARQCLT